MKIKKNNTQNAQKFWENADKAQRNVETWPEWKKNVQLTSYSNPHLAKKDNKERSKKNC